MTPAKLARLKELQRLVASGAALNIEEQAALLSLRRELAAAPEVADDPATLADESRRPNIAGGDYLDEQKARDARELEAAAIEAAKKYGPTLLEIAWAFIRGLFRK